MTLRSWGLMSAFALLAAAFVAFRLDKQALWPVVLACVADDELTGSPLPCLRADLGQGLERGVVTLRPPGFDDLIVAPTRKVVGIEDPFLQTPEAPNYFAEAWRARSFLKTPDGLAPPWDAIGLVANPAVVRNQDQLHIHVGCLLPGVRETIGKIAPGVPTDRWERLPEIIPHIIFWGIRIGAADLAAIQPFRLVAQALADRVRNRAKLTILVAGVSVRGEDGFLVMASSADTPHNWWAVGDQNLLDRRCAL